MTNHIQAGGNQPSGTSVPSRELRKLEVHREPRAPYADYHEQTCEDCGGTGVETGGLHAIEYEPCGNCNGVGQVLVFRDWLTEAFRIAGPDRPGYRKPIVEREHLTALATYARQVVSAVYSLPEVA